MIGATPETVRLTEEARERRWPNVVPKDAATLLIYDGSSGDPRLLMGRRHDGHKFMPGKFVFPGGRTEPTDRVMRPVAPLRADVAARVATGLRRPSASLPQMLALAALRETFEETGLLFGQKVAAPVAAPPGAWTDFADHCVAPDLSRLHFIARAITPPRRPKRFDARFFAIDASHIAHRIEGIVGPQTELVELVWKPIEEALALDIPAITGVVLRELRERLAQNMAPDRPVPFYFERQRQWQRIDL